MPPDPYTGEGEKEVQRILHLQSIANNAPDAFVDTFNMKVFSNEEFLVKFKRRLLVIHLLAIVGFLCRSNDKGEVI